MTAVSVVAASSTDDAVSDAIGVLSYLVNLHLCEPFITVDLDGVRSPDMDEIPALQIAAEKDTPQGLNMALASQGALDCVRLVTATTRTTRGSGLDHVAAAANALSQWIRPVMPATVEFVEARLSVPVSDTVPDIEAFFGPTGIANLIALGEDEMAIGAVPLMADAFTEQQRAAHVAFEIATAAGLWTGMNTAPIDEWEFDAGAGSPAKHVAFVSSAARVVLDASPDTSEALRIHGQLPVPTGLTFVPPFDGIVNEIVESVYPPGLRYHPTDRIEGNDNGRTFTLGAVLRELGRLPVYALRSARRDLAQSGQENIRKVLTQAGFEDVTLTDREGDDGLLNEHDVDAIIESAKKEAMRPKPNPIPGEYWRSLIAGILGMIDGAAEAASVRASVSEQNQVLTDQSRFVVPGTDLAKTRRALAAIPSKRRAKQTKKAPKTAKGTPPKQEQPPPADTSAQPKVTPQKKQEEPANASAKKARTNQRAVRRHTVLTKIGVKLRNAAGEADVDFDRNAGRIRTTAQGLAEWQQLEIISIVPWILALGAFLLAFSVGALMPSRTVVELAYFDGVARVVLFAAASVLLVLLSGLTIIGRSGSKWQRNAAFGAVLLGIAAGVLVAWVDKIVFDAPDWAGVTFGVLVVILTLLGAVHARDSGDAATARMLRNAALLYLAAIAIISGARSDLWLQQNMDTPGQSRLAIAFIIGAIVTAVAVSVIVALARVHQQGAISSAAHEFYENKHNLGRAADASGRLQSALAQWTYTGAGLNYLIQYPFGKVERGDKQQETLQGVGLLRFRLFALELTPDGRQSLLASQLLASTTPGWLNRQYDAVVTAFSEREARIHGLPESESESFNPDGSEIPLTLDSDESVTQRSPRVRFAEWLTEGEGDSRLANPIHSDDLVASYRTVLDYALSYQLRPLGAETASDRLNVSELFTSIIPTIARHVPQSVIPGSLFGANDPEQKMVSAVWWPRTFAKQPTHKSEHLNWNESTPFSDDEDGYRAVLQAIRFDRSSSFPIHEIIGITPPAPIPKSVPEDQM